MAASALRGGIRHFGFYFHNKNQYKKRISMLFFHRVSGIVGIYTTWKEVIAIANTRESLPAKERILKVCVRLFLEKGYKRTTLAEIIREADVSCSSFQNIFQAKDGVLTELVEFMFSSQFGTAKDIAGAGLPPVCVYAVETAIQLTLTELNENLREIYIEAYTQKDASEYIHREMAKELPRIFGGYLPGLTERDFYEMEIGSGSVMRGYMAHPCDGELTLERKLQLFLTMSLRAYKVPEEELERVLAFIEGLNIRAISEHVMQKLFQALAMHFEFSLAGIPVTTKMK
jgi:AcrR family transcriptional regulator